MKTLLLLIMLLTPLLAPAAEWQQMSDRQKTERMWCALAQFESGDRDHARGRHGEIGAYQILPREWRVVTAWPVSMATDRAAALFVSQTLMKQRVEHYDIRYGHLPTLFEWYVLYNAPAQVRNPSPEVASRATRFVTLCLK